MKKISYLLLILITVFCINSAGQIPSFPDNTNFYDYLEYFYDSENYDETDTTEGGENSNVRRLSTIWGKRLHPHGNFSIAAQAIMDYAENFNPSNRSGNYYPNWVCLGPSNTPPGVRGRGMGQIHRISFDPRYDGQTNTTIYAATSFGGLWRSEDDAQNWSVVNTDLQLPICNVADVAINPYIPETIFIATGSADGGVTIEYSPNWANINPIFTMGIYRSNDYGNTWEPINTGFLDDFIANGGGTVRRLISNQNNPDILFAATTLGIYRSTNANNAEPQWENVFTGITGIDGDFRCVAWKPGLTNTIYASSSDIFISYDAGNTWSSMTGPGTGLDFSQMSEYIPHRINLAVTPADSERLYAYIWGFDSQLNKNRIYFYIYQNNQWTQLYSQNGYIAKEWLGFAASPVNPDEIYFYGVKQGNNVVYGTTDLTNFHCIGGYVKGGFHADCHVLEFQPNVLNPKLFAGHHGGISIKEDLSIHGYDGWEFKNNGLQTQIIWSFDQSEYETHNVAIGNQDCGIFLYSKDNGIDSWEAIGKHIGDVTSVQYLKTNPQYLFMSYYDNNLERYNFNDGSIYLYEGSDYNRPTDQTTGQKAHIGKSFHAFAPPTEDYTYFGFSELYKRLTDIPIYGEDLWEFDSDIGKIRYHQWKRQITEFDYCLSDPNYIYVATGGVYNPNSSILLEPLLCISTIGGNNGNYSLDGFIQLQYPGIGQDDFPVISGIAVHPDDPNKLWISMIGYNLPIQVAYSEDGGETWTDEDPNKTLPNLPINNIVYQYGSNDILYIATDVGVYVKEGTNNWEKYGDIPNVRVMELKINYCSNKLRAATFGRGLWEADLIQFSDLSSIIINENEQNTWNNSKSLKGNLVIKNGAELIIKNKVNMPPNSKIIIERGAKLIVDGGHITNGCGYRWEGIEVWGDSDQHQFEINGQMYQGLVELYNATIENAHYGIYTIKKNNGNPDWGGYTGGVILAENTTFLNCWKAVEFWSYHNYDPFDPLIEVNNISEFKNCTFKTDEGYLAFGTGPTAFVTMWDVHGIRFLGNEFINTSPSSFLIENRGMGIYSEMAGCYFDSFCTDIPECTTYKQNTFDNLYYAIQAWGDGLENILTVNDAHFNDNYRSIYLNGMNDATITLNSFWVQNDYYTDYPYGLYLDGCTGYSVEENNFYPIFPTPPSVSNFGLIINNSGAEFNQIYNNTFNHLYIGLGALGDNRGINEITGLKIKCNDFTENEQDILVTNPFVPIDPLGISFHQGSDGIDQTTPAGNTFSHNPNGFLNSDYDNELKNFPFIYFHHIGNELDPWIPYYYQSATITLQTTNWIYTSKDDVCPSQLVEETRGEMESNIAYYDLKIDSVNQQLNELINGGNTDQLQTDIQTSIPPEGLDLRNDLISKSPYLSDSIMISAIQKEDVLNSPMIRDVLIENQQSAKSSEVMNELFQRTNPLPDYMIEEIEAGIEIASEKEKLESKLSHYKQKRHHNVKKLIKYYKLDSTNAAAKDSISSILQREKTVEAKYSLVLLYLASGDTLNALNTLNDIPNIVILNTKEQLDYYDFKEYFDIIIEVYRSNSNYFILDSTDISRLENLADLNRNVTAAYARSILNLVGEFNYTEPIIIPTGLKTVKIKTNSGNNSNYKDLVYIYPNPASTYIVIDFQYSGENESGIFEIYDLEGRLIKTVKLNGFINQQIVEIKDLKTGVYVCKCISNNNLIKSLKLTVLR